MQQLVAIITAADRSLRNQSVDAICARLPVDQLLQECAALDAFRRRSDNLYERVRALFFLYAIHRFHLPAKLQAADVNRRAASADPLEVHLLRTVALNKGLIPFKGYEQLLQRRFEEAIENFLSVQNTD